MATKPWAEMKAEWEAERARVEAMHPVTRWFYCQLPDHLNEVLAWFENKWYEIVDLRDRLTKGYTQIDWWSYHTENSKRAVTLLTLLKEKGHGFMCMRPSTVEEHDCWDGYDEAKWKEALDDMIFFHKVNAGLYEEDFSLNAFGVYRKPSTTGYGFQTKEDYLRYRRGKYYYMKYYESLWD